MSRARSPPTSSWAAHLYGFTEADLEKADAAAAARKA
jgi:hypothetical protein